MGFIETIVGEIMSIATVPYKYRKQISEHLLDVYTKDNKEGVNSGEKKK